jgi:hypothetical protein
MGFVARPVSLAKLGSVPYSAALLKERSMNAGGKATLTLVAIAGVTNYHAAISRLYWLQPLVSSSEKA